MAYIVNPIWDQRKKAERNAVKTPVREELPCFKTAAERKQEAAEAERKAAALKQTSKPAAPQKYSSAEAPKPGAEAPKPGNAVEVLPVPGQPDRALTPIITTAPFITTKPASIDPVPPAKAERQIKSKQETPIESEAAALLANPAALSPSHAPTQKKPRRHREQGLLPERRSLRAQYDVFPFPVAAEYMSSSAFLEPVASAGAFLELVASADAFLEAVQRESQASRQPGISARSRAIIAVCVQFDLPNTADGVLSVADSEEAGSAYLGEALYFAKPLSISVAAVTGCSQASTFAAENTFSAVLMPTRRAPRIPKLNHVIALALPYCPHDEFLEAFDLAEMGKNGADVFIFAPGPFLGLKPGKPASRDRLGRLPNCPVPGYIKLLIPDFSVQDKSVQRKLEVLLVDLSPGASFGTLPALPAPCPARSSGFDWAALLEADREEYKAAAAEQAQQVLQHVLSLRDTG